MRERPPSYDHISIVRRSVEIEDVQIPILPVRRHVYIIRERHRARTMPMIDASGWVRPAPLVPEALGEIVDDRLIPCRKCEDVEDMILDLINHAYGISDCRSALHNLRNNSLDSESGDASGGVATSHEHCADSGVIDSQPEGDKIVRLDARGCVAAVLDKHPRHDRKWERRAPRVVPDLRGLE